VLPTIGFEIFLGCLARERPAAQAATPTIAMPEEWRKRPVQIAGTKDAYYWHGHLHVLNEDGMRIIGSFPPKQEGTFRVMVVGDSLTYGMGIAEPDTYCRILERDLGRRYRIEVLNLGRMGDQSEDILKTVKAKLPLLKPDLVVYGVCLNDFLPSGVGQYDNNMRWRIDFPGQRHLIERTSIGPFLAGKYNDVLRTCRIRNDFYEDILSDFQGYQQRFGRDVKEMNEVVVAGGLPPVVAMVLHQSPGEPPSDEIAAITEQHLAAAGMEVVPAAYLKEHVGKRFNVSLWEGHPNEEAHRIFAGQLQPYIEKTPALVQYQR
jgi:lysophospholipase L1-like esterase